MHRIITKVEPLENLTFKATFATGEVMLFDVKILFEQYPIFTTLKDVELFRQLRIDGVGYGVHWNDELDLSSDGIYKKGKLVGRVDPDIKIVVGEAIMEAREKVGISQRELSRRSGIIQAELSKIEQGKGNPTITTLEKIAKSLNCPISSFLL